MDAKRAKEVDSLYRNIKQLPLLGCLGFFIPMIGVLLLPIVFAYMYLRRRLLHNLAKGEIVIDDHDCLPQKGHQLSTKQKIDAINNANLGVPILVGTLWLGLIAFFVLLVAFR
jgi:hypothetical protein